MLRLSIYGGNYMSGLTDEQRELYDKLQNAIKPIGVMLLRFYKECQEMIYGQFLLIQVRIMKQLKDIKVIL